MRNKRGRQKTVGQTVDPLIVYRWHNRTPSCIVYVPHKLFDPNRNWLNPPAISKCNKDDYSPFVSVDSRFIRIELRYAYLGRSFVCVCVCVCLCVCVCVCVCVWDKTFFSPLKSDVRINHRRKWKANSRKTQTVFIIKNDTEHMKTVSKQNSLLVIQGAETS